MFWKATPRGEFKSLLSLIDMTRLQLKGIRYCTKNKTTSFLINIGYSCVIMFLWSCLLHLVLLCFLRNIIRLSLTVVGKLFF